MNTLKEFLERAKRETALPKPKILGMIIAKLINEETKKGKIPTKIFINSKYKAECLDYFKTNMLKFKLDNHFVLYNMKVIFFESDNDDEDYYIGYNIYEMLRCGDDI